MKKHILALVLDDYVLVCSDGTAHKISSDLARRCIEAEVMGQLPPEIAENFSAPMTDKVADHVHFRINHLGFVRASYEITGKCNYRCEHCYLGDSIRKNTLTADQKLTVIDRIVEAGCLWFQLTGGEPTVDRDFEAVYRHAVQSGLLVTLSTNGSLLSKKRVSGLLQELPPYRLVVSCYGATNESYECLTHSRGSFDLFMTALAISASIVTNKRMNIILTVRNCHEEKEMVALAEKYGYHPHVYREMSPAFDSSVSPMSLQVQCGSQQQNKAIDGEWHQRCLAGQRFFHVDPAGRASICKLSRQPSVNLLESVAELSKLRSQVGEILSRSEMCQDCSFFQQCQTCPPKLDMVRGSRVVLARICKKGGKP